MRRHAEDMVMAIYLDYMEASSLKKKARQRVEPACRL